MCLLQIQKGPEFDSAFMQKGSQTRFRKTFMTEFLALQYPFLKQKG